MNDKTNDCETDARVGDVECRPGMQEGWRMRAEIEKEKIDDLPVKNAVGEISEHAGSQ